MRRILSQGLRALAVIAALLLGLGTGAVAQAGNAALPAAGAGSAAGALAVKRLILTDGSYQTVAEWKKVGDRVEYFSSERGEWEELPDSLVDWKATEEWNAEAAKNQAEELKQESGEEVAARKEAELNTPQVAPEQAPELRLPAEGGVFLLEERAGKPVLQQLNGVAPQEIDQERGPRLRLPMSAGAGQRQTIELNGGAARVRVIASRPSIFVDVENERGVIAGGDFRLVRLERRRGQRVVATSKGGKESVQESFLPLRAEKFSGDWWKLTPLEELTPGEYAIMTAGAEDAGMWDFGVDR